MHLSALPNNAGGNSQIACTQMCVRVCLCEHVMRSCGDEKPDVIKKFQPKGVVLAALLAVS